MGFCPANLVTNQQNNTNMSNTLRSFVQKIYKPIAEWIHDNVATKTELSSNASEHLYPVDISSLTPSSTFRANSVIGINGVLYRSTKQTSNLPVTLTVQNGAFVANIANGKVAFVVQDSTINDDWVIFADASIEYWVNTLNSALSNKQDAISDLSTIRSNASSAVKPTDVYTCNGVNYTVASMLTELVKLMPKKVVTQN